MERKETAALLKYMLREQLCCLGRVFARHGVADDVVWEVVKGFDLIYQRTMLKAKDSGGAGSPDTSVHRMEPHPGLMHLLKKIER